MFTLKADGVGKVYVLRAEGVLTDADYEELIPKFDDIIATHGPIRLLSDVTGLEGMEPLAIWDDLMLGVRHWNDFERMVILGDASWQEVAAKVADLVTRGEVRYFDQGQRDDALKWLKS